MFEFLADALRNRENINHQGRARNSMGFKVGNANFDMQLQSCPEDQKVLVILVKEAKDVYLDDEKSVTDPFCRIDLLEPVNDFDQLQRTSQICATSNPVWNPLERFLFIVNKDSKITFTMMRNFGMNKTVAKVMGKTKRFLGDAIINVADFSTELKEFTLPLTDPDTDVAYATLKIYGKIISKEEAASTRHDVAHQYQRYVFSWHDENLLPTDRGRFSSGDNTIFGDNFMEVSEDVPDGWSVIKDWSTTASEDGTGWLYAFDFFHSSWYPQQRSNVYVRRKGWTRFIARDDFVEKLTQEDAETESVISEKIAVTDDVKADTSEIDDTDTLQSEI